MPQPRKYKTNAERQAAYRARKAKGISLRPYSTSEAVARRVVAADKAAQAKEA